jgi:exosortase
MSVTFRQLLPKTIAIFAALALLYSGVLSRLGSDWMADENYSHGLLIPFVIGFILWTEREVLRQTAGRPSTAMGLGLVLLAILMLWAGIAGAELYFQRISLVFMTLGLASYFWGTRLLRRLWVPVLLLLLAIPIPAIIFNKIAFPLQIFASKCAVWVMHAVNLPVLRQGNVIELLPLNSVETRKLEVVEACSGIRSLMTLITLAVIFAYFTRPGGDRSSKFSRGLRFAILVTAAVPIAVLTNSFRVSGTGILAHYYGTRVADGFFHTFSGWVIYIFALALLFGFGWLYDHVSKWVSQTKPPAPMGGPSFSELVSLPGAAKGAGGITAVKGGDVL